MASLRIFAVIAFLEWAVAAALAADPFVGATALNFEYDGEPAMLMPTAVAVGPDGVVYVADGVNDRVLLFDPEGKHLGEIRRVGERDLSSPVGVKIDEKGLLWIADCGNHRVVCCDRGGKLQREVRPIKDAGEEVDITDIAIDAGHLWIVENDQHRISRLNLSTNARTVLGREGESLLEFRFPFLIAVSPTGDLFVSDVINARVQSISSSGEPLSAIGVYGADLGQLYRPKGVAVDNAGNIWVSDGTLGVIQIFDPQGPVIDVLRGESGEPLRFASPMGISFDSHGMLYVVELGANRVRKLNIETSPPGELEVAQAEASAQGRSCTVCHFSWLPQFADGSGTRLAAAPEIDKNNPAVARSETCLSCHDGSVSDSRRRVWRDHGHLTGIEPPESMNVPANLPLVDGRIACRTCHTAHRGGEATDDIRRSVFLRVNNVASELCVSCHLDHTLGPGGGTHPTGGMPWSIPTSLIEAGASVGPNPRELTCQVCHTPHGARHEHLLVKGTDSNQLCLNCHEPLRPAVFRDGGESDHPRNPPVNSAQLSAIHAMGTKAGDDQTLICLSCHKIHHAESNRFLLAKPLSDDQMCLQCHSERAQLIGTPHDLRTNFPEERNRLGMTPETGGACSSCHLFHHFARNPAPGPGDPKGYCLTCHQPGECGSGKLIGSINHPIETCSDCHDPHHNSKGGFVRAGPISLCVECHEDQATILTGAHDIRGRESSWPDESGAMSDPCLSCHRPHGDDQSGLFRVAAAKVGGAKDGLCLSCHSDSAPGQISARSLLHPIANSKSISGSKNVESCQTCHDPHSGSVGLFVPTDSSDSLCVSCHEPMKSVVATPHGSDSIGRAGLEADSCKPCHSVHGNSEQVDLILLWPHSLTANSITNEGSSQAAQCVACHRKGGSAAIPTVFDHPDVPMANVAHGDSDDALPLFDSDGNVSPQGQVTCKSCHVVHGRQIADGSDTSSLGKKSMAHRLLLRPFKAPNVCTACHGMEGLWKYLYFHDPVRRLRKELSGSP